MEFLTTVLVLAVFGALLTRISAFLLGLVSWILLGFLALGLLVGVPVHGGVTVLTVLAWLASQLVSRLRTGGWRSATLRGVSRAVDAVRASA